MLKFVKPFNQESELHINKTERRMIEERFVALCFSLLDRHVQAIRSVEEIEESGPINVFEASLIIPSLDSSYLHVLVFGHNNAGGFIDVNIAIEEHDDTKRPSGGYMYSYDATGLIRTKVDKEDDIEDDEDVHFSIIAMYEGSRQLTELELNGSDDERLEAIELREELEQGATLGIWEHEMGYDGRLPSLEEVTHLAEILDYALPRQG